MSEQPNDGGPAFPVVESHPTMGTRITPGMSLRAYIATKAMAAIIAHPGMEPDDASRIGVADLALEFADALIAALNERPQL